MQAEDQEHKGRFGRAVNPELDLEYQTGVFFDTAGIRPRPGCTKTLVDAAGFSGVCCRMGNLSVAIEAGVPEHILWIQSGHSQDKSARGYARLTDPDRLYDTW